MSVDFAIDPASQEFRTHSAAYFSRLLRESPVARTVSGQWLICRHRDVREILTDHARFQRPAAWSVGRKPEGPLRDFGRNNMVGMNPPEHTRFRQSAVQAFTRRAVQEMRPAIAALVDRLLERMASRDGGDFIADFAFPLPVYVICEMLGISHEDHDLFGRCTADMLASLEMSATGETFARGTAAAKILFDYCGTVAKAREASPCRDLVSSLLEHEAGGKISREEAVWIAVTLLIAGHETTTHMLGNGLLALVRNPAQLEALAADPSLAANAVEEVLRYDPTLYVLFRENRVDVEFGGETIPAGSFLVTSLFAANRDPEVFASPDDFDIRRANADQHLSFGAGRHLCLGHLLARLEGAIAFERMFRRLGGFRLAGEPAPRNGLMFRGYHALPMQWSAAG